MMQEHKRATINATVVVSIPTRGNKIFNFFISSHCHDTWHGVEFHHSTHIVSRMQRRVGNEIVLNGEKSVSTLGFLSAYLAK